MIAARAYAKTTNETASKERLLVLLLEAALKHMRSGAAHFDSGKPLDALPALTKASDIVTELAATLNAEVAPQLASTLGDLYLFVTQRLSMAAFAKDASMVREAERVFAPIVDAFSQAVSQMASEAAMGGTR